MSKLLDMAEGFFEARHWRHRRVAEPVAIEVAHEFSVEPFRSYAQAKNGDRVFTYRSICAERVAPDRRAEVMRYITRVNFGQLVGSFELDLDEGEVRSSTIQSARRSCRRHGGRRWPST